MSSFVVGIDLGTTNSGVCYFKDGTVMTSINSEGDRKTPSFVFYTKSNKVITGKYAKHLGKQDPARGIYEIKRLMGRSFDDPFITKNLKKFKFKIINEYNKPVVYIESQKENITKTPEEVSSCILRKIKSDVEEKLGEVIDKVVITVPAYFNIAQREATLEAAKGAGLTVLKLLNEPTAAALAFYHANKTKTNTYSLVYDLGEGTFDVAIVHRKETDIEIICVDGDTSLGGHDFDTLIINYVWEELKKEGEIDASLDRTYDRRIYLECEEAKMTLSSADEAWIILEGLAENRDDVNILLTREKFEDLAKDLFARTIKITKRCLIASKLAIKDIDDVILVGGSTRIPKIQQLLSEFFEGKELNHFNNPEECVAEGAAIQAAMLSVHPDQKIDTIKIVDVIPLSIGISSSFGRMSFLIKKNSSIPCSGEKYYRTVCDQQESITFSIYEGERLQATKNYFLGELELSDLTPAPPGKYRLVVTFNIDLNGILTIEAKETCKNNVKDLKITYNRGNRSNNEIRSMVVDAEENKEEDTKFDQFAKLKENVIDYSEKVSYNSKNKKLSIEEHKIIQRCREIKQIVKNMQIEDQELVEKLRDELKLKCDPLVEKYNFSISTYYREVPCCMC